MKLTPTVKWAGGKRQIIDKLKKNCPKRYKTYYEPFVGGGALFLELKPKHAVINDLNKDLICIYKCLKSKKWYKKMIALLNEHEQKNSKEYFYEIRSLDTRKTFIREPMYVKAARCIYLNKSCFNGLYRVNSNGCFNVPFNGKDNINCYDRKNMNALHRFFMRTNPVILSKDFEAAVATAKAGDFVYFDPPYDSLDDKNSFTSYTKDSFGKEEQKRLAKVYKDLSNKGVYVMLSNHNTKFINELYSEFNIHVINAKRMINSKADGRGDVEEVIITNY